MKARIAPLVSTLAASRPVPRALAGLAALAVILAAGFVVYRRRLP